MAFYEIVCRFKESKRKVPHPYSRAEESARSLHGCRDDEALGSRKHVRSGEALTQGLKPRFSQGLAAGINACSTPWNWRSSGKGGKCTSAKAQVCFGSQRGPEGPLFHAAWGNSWGTLLHAAWGERVIADIAHPLRPEFLGRMSALSRAAKDGAPS